MATTSLKHTHNLPVELQFRGIPTTWTAGENSDNQRVLFPSVSQNDKKRLPPIDDPEDIRKQFFRAEFDERSALEFLNTVGVWFAVEDWRDWEKTTNRRTKSMRVRATSGHRHFNGRAVVATVESLQHEQKYWRELRRNRNKLRAAFSPPPSGDGSQVKKEWFAVMSRYGNTLPVHLEWRGKHPHAVIEAITGRELLTALAWIDLVTGAECKVCQKCGTEYSRGGRKFCSWQCEHANTMRTYRQNLKEKQRANGKKSTS